MTSLQPVTFLNLNSLSWSSPSVVSKLPGTLQYRQATDKLSLRDTTTILVTYQPPTHLVCSQKAIFKISSWKCVFRLVHSQTWLREASMWPCSMTGWHRPPKSNPATPVYNMPRSKQKAKIKGVPKVLCVSQHRPFRSGALILEPQI
jgi:hypothetical protein